MNWRVARYAAMSLVCAMGASIWADAAVAEFKRHRDGDPWTEADRVVTDGPAAPAPAEPAVT